MVSPKYYDLLNLQRGHYPTIIIGDIDAKAFEQILNLWCWKKVLADNAQQLRDVMVTESVEDLLDMLDVLAVFEAASFSWRCVLRQQADGLGQVEEEAWGKLLEEDELGIMKEEEAFEGLMGAAVLAKDRAEVGHLSAKALTLQRWRVLEWLPLHRLLGSLGQLVRWWNARLGCASAADQMTGQF